MLRILPKIFTQTASERDAAAYRALIHEEAKIGGQLFGPIPAGHRREFFCLDQQTWVWHEEWEDEQGQHRVLTTRYDIRPNGILKVQNNNQYQTLSAVETANLYRAAHIYQKRVEAMYRPRLQVA